jgi:hypothetical protein
VDEKATRAPSAGHLIPSVGTEAGALQGIIEEVTMIAVALRYRLGSGGGAFDTAA